MTELLIAIIAFAAGYVTRHILQITRWKKLMKEVLHDVT